MSKKNNKNNKPNTKPETNVEETVEEVVEETTAEVKEAVDTASEVEAKESKKEKAPKKPVTIAERKVRHGILATTSVVVVIALVILLNVFLSSKEWNYDCSKDDLYTLSEESKGILKDLDKDVNIYFLNSESKANTVYKNILSQYAKSSKVDVQYKDRKKFPQFANEYLDEGAEAADDDMIIVCGDRHRYLASTDYLNYGYDESGNYSTTVNIEPKVTAAISYCVSGETPSVYTLTGQGEQELGNGFKSALEMDNYKIENLDLLSSPGIPDDCSLLIINAPSADLPEAVLDILREYMSKDGKLFVVVDPNEMYKNLNKFLLEYGVKVNEGVMLEMGSGYFMGNYPTYLLPTLNDHEITAPISKAGYKILCPIVKGLSTEKADGYDVTELLVTSSQSYSKIDTKSGKIEKEDKDIAGPLSAADVVNNASGDGVMFVSGCSSMGVDEIDGYVAGANVNFYANAVNYLVGQSNMISVKPTTVSNDMAVFTARASKMVIAVGIIGLPLFLILLGVAVIIVRKNK